MERAVIIILTVTFPVIVVMNIVGFLVGGIWLLFLGEWRIVVSTFVASFIFPFAYGLFAFIQMPFTLLAGWLSSRHLPLMAMLPGFLSMLMRHVIDLAWVIGVFVYMGLSAAEGNTVPYYLYGWSIVTGPFQWMASKEAPDSIGSYAAVWLAGMSYLILVGFHWVGILAGALPLIIVLTLLKLYLLRNYLKLQHPSPISANG